MAKVGAVNIRKIAERAGVSHITVSRALRGQSNVSAATRKRIESVAAELGYKNNPLVQAYAAHIRRGGGGTAPACNLAWLRSYDQTGGPMHAWQKAYHDGAVRRAGELGYSIDASINAHDYSDAQLDRLLNARGVRGVILPFTDYFYREPYQAGQMATVAIGESPSETPIHSVTTDYFKNMTTAVDRLLAYGYKRIGFCEHSYATVINQGAHWGAYLFNQQRMKAANRLKPLIGFMSADIPVEHSKERFFDWLKRERPDALITTFSQAMDWLAEGELRVPEDIAVAHMGLSADVTGWSGVASGDKQIGAAAIDLLTAHIMRNEYGIPNSPKHMKISGRWIDGTTTVRPKGKLKAYLPESQTHSGEWFDAEFFGKK